MRRAETNTTRRVRLQGLPAVMVCMLLGCAAKPTLHKKIFFRMDTVSEISIVSQKKYKPAPLWKSIDSLLVDWEIRFSVKGPGSEVEKLNSRTSPTMPVSSSMAKLISLALRYGDTLNAGFDLTILPVKEVWGFGEGALDSLPLPDSAAVGVALAKVSYKNVVLNAAGDSVRFLSPATRIDVGGIAKGCVLAEVAGLIDSRHITRYLVVAGGDIVVRGRRPDGKRWLIGVQHPRNLNEYLATIPVQSGYSVVTSGDYERFRIVDGVRYHHLFDSHSGQTCRENQSVTVYGPDPVVVDVLSTGLFCRSAQEIVDFINKRPAFQCLVIDSSETIFVSDNWSGNLLHGKK